MISRIDFTPTDPSPLRVYVVRNKQMTRVSDPLQEVMCDLAIENLSCRTEVEQAEWIGSDRLRVRVLMLCGDNHDKRELTYVVDAKTGHVLDPIRPQRNWSCQPGASGGPVPGHATLRPGVYH